MLSSSRDRPCTPPQSFSPANYETTLDVAIYHPVHPADPRHWAIHILSPRRRGTLHQVRDDVGGRGYYVSGVRWRVSPRSARLFRRSTYIGRIRYYQVRLVRRLVQRWRVNNRSQRWDCQAWVVELGFALRRAGLLRLRWRGARGMMREREYWQ